MRGKVSTHAITVNIPPATRPGWGMEPVRSALGSAAASFTGAGLRFFFDTDSSFLIDTIIDVQQ